MERIVHLFEQLRLELSKTEAELTTTKLQKEDYERKLEIQSLEFALIKKTISDLQGSFALQKQRYEEEIDALRKRLVEVHGDSYTFTHSTTTGGISSKTPATISSSTVFGLPSSNQTATTTANIPTNMNGLSLVSSFGNSTNSTGSTNFSQTSLQHLNNINSGNIIQGSSNKSNNGSGTSAASVMTNLRPQNISTAVADPTPSSAIATTSNNNSNSNSNNVSTFRRASITNGTALTTNSLSPTSGTFPISASNGNSLTNASNTVSGTANNNPSNRGHSFSGPPDFLIVYNPQLIGRTNHVNINMLHSFEHQSIVCCVKFSKDGQYFATGSNRQAQIFDVASAQRLRCFLEPTKKLNEDSYVRTVAFSPNGQYLVSGSEDKSVKVWDIAASNLKSVLTGHELDIYAVEVSSDNRFVVSGSGDGKTKIWDLQKLSLIHTLDAPVTSDSTNATGKLSGTEGVTSIAITPDNALIATGCLDNVIRLWDSETGQLVHTLQGHQDSVYALSFSPDGRNLVSGSLDKNLKIWNVVNTQCVSTLTGHRDYVLSVVYSVDGNWVISGSKDRSVQFWDVRNDQLHLMLQGHRNSVISIGMSPAQPVFGTGSGDCRARIWKYDVTNLVATQ